MSRKRFSHFRSQRPIDLKFCSPSYFCRALCFH